MAGNNIISKYWNQFGYHAASGRQLTKAVAKAAGRKYADAIDKEIERRADGNTEGDFYSLKNSSFEGSIALGMAYDENVYLRASELVMENKKIFGKTILDLGCDNGMFTCFLAKCFPEAEIVGVDRCEAAVQRAEELAEKLKLSNVSFVCEDIWDYSVPAETVVSIRTMNEMIHNIVVNRLNSFAINEEACKKACDDYAKKIRSLVNGDGSFFSFERTRMDHLFAGWLRSLEEQGLYTKKAFAVDCRENGIVNHFCFAVANTIAEEERKAVLTFAEACMNYYDSGRGGLYRGTAAQIYFETMATETIKGFSAYDPTWSRERARFGYCYSNDQTSVIFYNGFWDDGELTIEVMNYDISMMDEIENQLPQVISQYKYLGCSLKEIDLLNYYCEE